MYNYYLIMHWMLSFWAQQGVGQMWDLAEDWHNNMLVVQASCDYETVAKWW